MPEESTRMPHNKRPRPQSLPPPPLSGVGAAEQRTRMPEQPKKHLYLAFDDWKFGYSIRKVHLPEQSSDPGEDLMPVFMRIRALRGYPRFFTSAFGPKIMALHPSSCGDPLSGIQTIDVQDHTITSETPPNVGPLYPLYIPVSDEKLFAMDFGSFDVLRKKEPSEPSDLWMWERVNHPPFPVSDVLSHSVRPDGCILFSVDGCKTFIFNAKEQWKLCGAWVFPFIGHGHYDPSLEGFVGLSREGYLSCCIMASTGDTWLPPPGPDVKCTEDKVVNKDSTEGAEGQHVSATLLHICPGKFCLVECVCTDNTTSTDEDDPELPPGADGYDFMGGGPQGGRFMYRVKTFNLSYGTKGDLKLTNCIVRCYSLPHEARIGSIRQNPVAFCL